MRSYTFDWREDEHRRASAHLARQRLKRRPVRWIVAGMWAFLVLAALFAVLLVAVGDGSGAARIGALTVACGLLLGLAPAIVARVQTRSIARSDPNARAPLTFTFMEGGLQVQMQHHQAELAWAGITRVEYLDGLLLVYYQPLHAYVLPGRAVGTDADVRELMDWVQARLLNTAP